MEWWTIIVPLLIIGFIFIFKNVRDYRLLKTVTSPNRGTRSERDLVLKLLKHGVPFGNIYHDLYLKKHSGEYSQIDLVVLTTFGIMVFEIKEYSGWIYGNGNHSQWSKVLAYGKNKYRFYNPIMQNSKHIQDLKNQLKKFGSIPFYSIIVFYGNCVLKDISFVPKGTYIVNPNRVIEVMRIIEKENEPVFYKNRSEVNGVLKNAVINGENGEIRKQHIEYINDMLGRHRIFD